MLSHLELGSVSVEILLGLLQKSLVLNIVEEFKEKLYSFKKGVSFAILEFHYLVAEASGSFAYIIVPTMLRCDIVPARNCLHMVTVFLAKR